ncbi:divergent polysaccharide deacetylase family protein [Enterovirga aerilata]|uniref:Divergent polysaccharide deacetylase family protein n=1 Tax=Enterovirga aerilata TaxID=2730920 RepID=A0A849I0H5_9HYPH|nr:divergent polysaccharide deacetylase family protein [Enterovirga sp. DB1703]NNM70901.1 divergent polysaccharide deacetylase family protein [Enterovirga sp. DB1703]
MGTTSDELTRPLGRPRAEPKTGSGLAAIRIAGAVCAGLLVAAGGYVYVAGDPQGGIPRIAVEIGAKAPARQSSTSTLPDVPVGSGPQTAESVEGASGVSVVRPDGTAAPQSIIVRIPDEAILALNPAPDRRLVEATRFGTLPRIGPDGSRPLDVYARAATGLPGGARPVARVAIVVGGLGISQSGTLDAIAKLPPAVTLAFAPYGQDLDRLAARAREDGHEIILQVPMEPFDYPDSDPGPHTLLAAARPAENIEHLHWAMGRLSGYVGLMNYMGGKLTADARAIAPILREIGARGLGFLDDGSSPRSVATLVKGDTPMARADVVVDASGRPDGIDRALERLETAASGGGIAIGTATALPLSVERIARWAKGLEARGILLVPASAALRSAVRESATR